jgi:general secretion pathway protein D
VFVEAVLLEVTYTESKDAGTSMHGVSPLENNGMLLAGTNLADVNSMSLLSSLLASSSGSLTMPNGITVGALGQPVEVPGTNGQVVLPSAGLIVRLLASESNVNVLSTPTILTTDNEEASLEVGQKIPVQTGSSTSGVGYSTISISRESVGIKLKITPQINESDAIRLEIFTEISGVASTDSIMGPTTSLKTAETTVIVRDSQTIVIGGLMEDRQDLTTTKIPWLGDIPVLGWLFKNSTRGKNKTNLIILITPHIVKSDADVERVKQHIRQGYEDMAEESLGEGAPDWSAYFESQLREPKETIDLRSGQPQVVPAPEWGWTPAAPGSPPPSTPAPPAPAEPAPAEPKPPAPAAGDTVGPGPRSATTNGAPPSGTPHR